MIHMVTHIPTCCNHLPTTVTEVPELSPENCSQSDTRTWHMDPVQLTLGREHQQRR